MQICKYIIIPLLLFTSLAVAGDPEVTPSGQQPTSNKEQAAEKGSQQQDVATEPRQAEKITNDPVDKKDSNDQYADYTTVKLSPSMRSEKISNSKYNLNTTEIYPYLSNVIFFDKEEQFKNLPFSVL